MSNNNNNNNNNRRPLEKEKSLHLRDIFGSTYLFEDDPVDLITASLHSGNVSATPPIATTLTAPISPSSSSKEAPQHVNRNRSRSASARLPRLAATTVESSSSPMSSKRPTPGSLKRTASLKSLRQRKQNRQAQQKAIMIRDNKSQEKYKPSHNDDEDDDDDTVTINTSDKQHSSSTGLERMSSFAKKSSTNKSLSDGNTHNNHSSHNTTEDENSKEIQLGMRQHHQAQHSSDTTPDLEAAATQIYHQSFFQDEYEDHSDENKQQHASVGSSGPMILAHATTNKLSGSNNNNSNSSGKFLDENSETTTNDRDKLLATVAMPYRVVVVDEHETRRRRWCIACGVGVGLLTLFMTFNLIMMAIWNPNDVIPTDVSFGEEAGSTNGESTTPTTIVPTTTLALDDLGPLPPSTMDAIQTQDINVPQFMAFAWLQADSQWPTYSIQRRRQRFALAVLYFATNPPLMHQWRRAGHWLSYKASECHWLYTTPEEQPEADREDVALNLCHVPPPKNSNDNTTATIINGNATQPPERNDDNKDDANKTNSTIIMIRHLPLANNNLQGRLPTEELAALLPQVVSVQLQSNPGLTGRLPSSWCPKRSRADADVGKQNQQNNNATIVHVQFDCAVTANNNHADNSGQEVESGGGLCGCHCPC